MRLTEKEEVDGLPQSLLALASATARAQDKGKDEESTAEAGPWLITLDGPSLTPFLQVNSYKDPCCEFLK